MLNDVRCYLNGRRDRWDECVPYIAAALKATVNRNIGFTLNRLMVPYIAAALKATVNRNIGFTLNRLMLGREETSPLELRIESSPNGSGKLDTGQAANRCIAIAVNSTGFTPGVENARPADATTGQGAPDAIDAEGGITVGDGDEALVVKRVTVSRGGEGVNDVIKKGADEAAARMVTSASTEDVICDEAATGTLTRASADVGIYM
ncbi:hypothetical protein PoB_004077100 [Plakobranchus ocellatus]|uniref:Uncharacterized protein n=1 Tax=Plakobranchus ocellatus TaxID=259542 RepID=A0AAV4B638_9GAST|nr:hypothetical protein PoB_004077100 [Plakobranchus ocellatus]